MIVKHKINRNEAIKMELVGNVSGNECIIVDDMIDSAETLCKATDMLFQKGAKKVWGFSTHGVFSGNAIEKINKSNISGVVITNSIPFNKEEKTNKVIQLSIGILIAEAIRRIQNNESLSELFKC